MKLKQLEKAQKLYDRVKELDGEIIEIEKTAQLIADKKTEIKLSLKVNDLEKKDVKEKVLDEDGSLIVGGSGLHRGLFYSMGLLGMPSCEKEKKKEYTIKHEAAIPDNVALQVLGVLLAEKMEARALAIKALNKIGIDI